jgi:Lar family restriction alleviation protein
MSYEDGEDEKLLPCPFCGSEPAKITLTEKANRGGKVISCTKCEACTRVFFPLMGSVDELLVEAWNRRQQP